MNVVPETSEIVYSEEEFSDSESDLESESEIPYADSDSYVETSHSAESDL